MASKLRAFISRIGYTTASFVLAISTLTAAVPFIVAQNVGAAPIYSDGGATATVDNEADLRTALNDASVSTININANITATASFIVTRTNLVINGNGHTITGPNLSGVWVENGNNYVMKVWNAYDVDAPVSIRNIKLTGANAGLLVSGSTVNFRGGVDVSGNVFGGIEVFNNGILSLAQGNITNSTESAGTPTIWTSGGGVFESRKNVNFQFATHIVNGQTQYYKVVENAGVVALNVTTRLTYGDIYTAVADATEGQTVRLEKDVVLPVTGLPTVRIDKAITFDGNGKKITAPFVRGDLGGQNNTAVAVVADGVTVENLTVESTDAVNPAHGFVVISKNVTLDHVATIGATAGVIINGGADVTVDSISTQGSVWYGLGVSGTGTKAEFIGSSTHADAIHIRVDTPGATTVVVPAGHYSLVNAGGKYTYTRDNTAPVTTLRVEKTVAGYVTDESTISGVATDDAHLNRILVQLVDANGVRYGKTVSFDRVGESSWSLAVGDFGTLADGVYSIHVTLTDNTGKSTVYGGWGETVILDNTAPDAPIVTEKSAEGISGTAEAGATVIVTIDGVSLPGVVADVDGNWSVEFEDALAVGEYDVEVIATDVAGNDSDVTSDTISVVASATDPEEDVEAPAEVNQEGASVAQGVEGILGDQDTNPDLTPGQSQEDNGEDKLGDSTEKVAEAVDTDNDSKIFGLDWYWWVVIVAAAGAAGWWIAAAVRGRKGDA